MNDSKTLIEWHEVIPGDVTNRPRRMEQILMMGVSGYIAPNDIYVISGRYEEDYACPWRDDSGNGITDAHEIPTHWAYKSDLFSVDRMTHTMTRTFPDVAPEVKLALAELEQANRQWPAYNSAHEAYAVLLEEVDELWDHVKVNQKRRDLPAMKKEAIQVAAVALRFAMQVCDDKTGRK